MRGDRVCRFLYGVIAVLCGGLVGNDNFQTGVAGATHADAPVSPIAWTLWGVGALLIGFALWPQRRRRARASEDAP